MFLTFCFNFCLLFLFIDCKKYVIYKQYTIEPKIEVSDPGFNISFPYKPWITNIDIFGHVNEPLVDKKLVPHSFVGKLRAVKPWTWEYNNNQLNVNVHDEISYWMEFVIQDEELRAEKKAVIRSHSFQGEVQLPAQLSYWFY